MHPYVSVCALFRTTQRNKKLPPSLARLVPPPSRIEAKLVCVANTSSTASGPLDVFEENSTVACDMLPKGEGFGEITAARLSVDET